MNSKLIKVVKNFTASFLILFGVLFVFIIKNPFYLNSTTPSTILSKHFWPNSIDQNQKILAGQIISAEFKATSDRLGAIETSFNVFTQLDTGQNQFDSLIFRIKEKGQGDWYYQNQYDRIRHSDVFFPFGFPVIETSKNKTYQIELESVSGLDETSFSFSSKNFFFLSKYNYPLSYLKQNTNQITPFTLSKISSIITSLKSISLINYIYIFIFSLLFSASKHFYNAKKQKITRPKKIFLNFLTQSGTLIIGVSLLLLFISNSELLEWRIYTFSTLGLFFSSFFFSYKLKNKLYPLFYNKLLNFFTLFFSSFVLILLLSQSLNPRHLVFLLLAFIPALTTYSKEIILINSIGILAILSYFNVDYPTNINFPEFPIQKLSLIFLITLVSYLTFQLRAKLIMFRIKIPRWLLFITLILITLYVTQKEIDYHHFSLYLGPAFDIAKGKSLLSHTPSMYGYLSIHFVSLILNKIGFSLSNFNLFNIVSYLGYFIIASLTLFKLTRNKLLSFSSSFIFITLQSLFSHYYQSLFPSTGPMRFGLGLLVIWSLIFFSQPVSFILGSFFASLSLFWAAETAVYVVPAWLATCLVSSLFSTNSIKSLAVYLAKKLLPFIIFTAIIFSAIICYEYSLLNTFPRLSDYFQYAIAYRDGFASILIPGYSSHYLIIATLILGLVTTTQLLLEKIKTVLLPALVFITIHNIAILSYFISRSHNNNIIAITGFVIIQLIIIFKILVKQFNLNPNKLKKIIAMPIILFLVLYSFRLIEHLNKSHQSTANQTKQNLTDWLTPTLQEPVLANALKDNNLQGQPIILLSRKFDTKLLIQSNLKNELPLNPAVMTSWLGDSWQQKYIEPYLTKIKPGTVVIVYTNVSNNFLGPVFSKIDSLYHLNKINTIDEKDLIIYQIDSLKKV